MVCLHRLEKDADLFQVSLDQWPPLTMLAPWITMRCPCIPLCTNPCLRRKRRGMGLGRKREKDSSPPFPTCSRSAVLWRPEGAWLLSADGMRHFHLGVNESDISPSHHTPSHIQNPQKHLIRPLSCAIAQSKALHG